VTLIVSSGREQVTVPDVSGRNQSAAANVLGQAGFDTTSQTQASENVESGTVIRTNPAAGTPLAKGSTVTMIVSSGSPPTTEPTPSTTRQSSSTSTTIEE
jgi:serine/threonine-protein kinase